MVIISLVFAAIANVLIFSGIRLLGAGTASVFEISYPLFVVVFSSVFLRTRPNLPFLVGALFVLIVPAIIVATSST
jgi:drug/metabolite transporter (DMT)-like permease